MTVSVAEMRKSPRLEVNAPAKLIFMSGTLRIKESFDCKIINISEGGALLESAHPITENEFYIESGRERKALYLCSVVRRESVYRVGVRFL